MNKNPSSFAIRSLLSIAFAVAAIVTVILSRNVDPHWPSDQASANQAPVAPIILAACFNGKCI
ncbi:MAG TPA: hypothetical protein VF601_16545 [Beijerinckiaceae bacterium]